MLTDAIDASVRLVLSDDGRKLIAGMMELAPSITALGNTNPTSYFRLVPHQEAPTSICWGDRNRSVLVRVPLGWTVDVDMSKEVNPSTDPSTIRGYEKQTVEIRSGDCSANVYLYIAALAVAARRGFEMGEDAIKLAKATYVDVDIHSEAGKETLSRLGSLPVSCADSADRMEQQRAAYEEKGVFAPSAIDDIIARLRSYDDADLAARAKADPELMHTLVMQYFHCG
ncbi:MAG: hypothetical protein K2O27_06285 [Candidatus Amulumruptor sp.]|nr:hypothetical protein [Candidatus Amulumruptor sp.]